jgi:putative endonuclease
MSRVSGKPYFVYVLWSPTGQRFYIGISENPTHRLEQHNAGISKWTAKFGPWRLVHMEPFVDYQGARKREIELKQQNSGEGFYKLIGRSFDDLSQIVKQSGS